MGKSFLCVLLGLILLALVSPITCVNISSTLQLSPGLRLNILSFYDLTNGEPLSLGGMLTVATPTLDAPGGFFPTLDEPGGFFLPIIASPSFITNSTSTSKFGYSLGFYMKPSSINDIYCTLSNSCNYYLAVCAGFLGSQMYENGVVFSLYLPNVTTEGADVVHMHLIQDGFAAPVWTANLNSPIRSVGNASLMVQRVPGSAGGSTSDQDVFELQLRDGENVVWRACCNANVMEMQDSGHLNLIYNSTNGSHVMWQSTPITDTLVLGQSLTVGKELISNDSSYVARMEKGGLVFYMNKMHFNRERQPPPYWVFPVASQDAAGSYNSSLNQIISSAPCSNSPAHVDPVIELAGMIFLRRGMCSPNYLSAVIGPGIGPTVAEGSLLFWRLEGDGVLYGYSVSNPGQGSATSVTKYSRKIYGVHSELGIKYTEDSSPVLALSWQECSLPMACGPLGLCTPGAHAFFCSCPPDLYFEPVNITNLLQGCKRRIDLPNCSTNSNGTAGHTSLTDFVELSSTATMLLFNEWTFNSTPGMGVDACKQSCSLDCSCNGFFYQVNTSSCFFMGDEISLMRVADKKYTPILSVSAGNISSSSSVFAKDYATFLKITAAHQANSTTSELLRKSSRGAALIAVKAIVPSVVVCLVLGMIAYLLIRARRKTHVHYTSRMLSAEESKELQDILPLLPSRFSYRELSEATDSFRRLLGAGGFGSVYAGVLSDGRKVAVKVLQAAHLPGIHQSKQFLAEIATIGRTHHHNIVRLLGFCWEVSQRLLVYEYVERGSLDGWIFSKDSVAPVNNDTSAVVEAAAAPVLLDWKARYNVALGIARGLNYSHEGCEQPILHFDIKPQNILLDNEFVAKLADFGMSRLMERDMSAVVTGMRGTPGYIAPEWCTQGTVSKRSDIYSMGMVFLEIVAGRKNLDFSLLSNSLEPEEQEAWHFPSWAARKCEQGLAMELVDRRLRQEGGGFDAVQALKLIHIAFWCIQENPAMRPYASTVVQWLEGSSSSDVEQPPFSTAVSIGRGSNNQSTHQPISFGSLVVN